MARYLGIEVTDANVKGVVVRAAYRKFVVESVHHIPRAPGPDGLAVAAGQLRAEIIGNLDAIYASLPGTEVSLRILELPKAVARRGGRILATELEGTLPFDVDAAVLDSQVIRADGNVELLAAAAPIARVESFLGALRGAGLEPRELAVGPVLLGELAAAVPELAVPGPVLILHAYESHADFCVVSNGRVQMARTLGAQTSPQARERGMRQTIGAYLSGGGAAPVVAYLCGDAGYYNMDAVANALELSGDAVKLGVPLSRFEFTGSASADNVQYAPSALAAALRGAGRANRIDLRKGPFALTSGTQIFREKGWLLAGCAAALVSSWGFATYARYTSLAEERDRLILALGNTTMEVFGQRVTDPHRAKNLATTGGPDTVQDPQPSADGFDVVGVLSNKIPDGYHHDIQQLDVNDDRVELQGVVDTLQHRDQIIEALQQYPCFQGLQPGRATRNSGDERQQYALTIELRCPERQDNSNTRRGTGGRTGSSSGSSGNAGGSRGGT